MPTNKESERITAFLLHQIRLNPGIRTKTLHTLLRASGLPGSDHVSQAVIRRRLEKSGRVRPEVRFEGCSQSYHWYVCDTYKSDPKYSGVGIQKTAEEINQETVHAFNDARLAIRRRLMESVWPSDRTVELNRKQEVVEQLLRLPVTSQPC